MTYPGVNNRDVTLQITTINPFIRLHCALSLAAQCIVIGPVCLWVCLWVCYHDNSKLLLHRSSANWVCSEGSDHLQLIKFWPSCAPGIKGVCGGAKIFGSALLQPARSVCVASERFFSFPYLVQKHKFYAVGNKNIALTNDTSGICLQYN